MNKRPLLGIFTSLLLSFCTKAQDIHFSQFYETAMLRNPALVGIFSEDYKVTFAYRNQWGSIINPFKTLQGEGQMRISLGNEVNDYVSIGLLGYSDKAGRINFQTGAYYAAVNYNKSLEDNHSSYLSVGFTGGYVQRSIDVSKMTFDNQYNNPGGAGESIPSGNISHWDLGAGLSFNSSPGESGKTSYYIGLGAYHFTMPKQSFYKDAKAVNLQIRWNVNAGLNLNLNDAWAFIAQGNYMLQGAYSEIIAGGLLRFSDFNNMNQKNFAFSGGVFYRLKDAIIPTVKLDYKGQAFSISYDINVSSLKAATNMRGGLELTLSKSGFFEGGINDKHMCPRF
jgi:type IX secretion system PorP/SprF family membrane protein